MAKADTRRTDEDVQMFLKEIQKVFNNFGMCLSHEDCGGAFLVTNYNKQDSDWVSFAHNETGNKNG